MRSLSLKRMSIPKVTVLAAGLVAAFMAATINPAPAQAFPRASNCAGCHASATGAVSTVTAVPSTATPAPGATYTVAITMSANPNAGNTGYGISPVTAGTGSTYGGNSGTQLSHTATMVAPLAAGTYSYNVWTNQGITDGTGLTGNKLYTITVAAAPVVVTTTTALAVTPVSPVVAPASPTLKATVSGAGAAGTVEFFNGTTSLGAPTAIAAGVASKTLSAIPAGSYSYTAKFVPTNAAAFAPSTSSAVAYLVTAAPPVVVTTTTALAVTPVSPVVAPASPSLKATVTGAGAAGLVEFFNGTTSLGTSPVAAGLATKALTGVAAGSYSYKAVFTPTDAALFTSSTSLVVAYVVTAAPPVVITTTTALAVTPASPVVAPASPTLTATVTGAGAAGSVEFFTGTTSLGTSPVAAGIATKALVGIGAGSYSYKAVFTPTDAALFTSSTSLVVAYVVTGVPVAVPVASFTNAPAPSTPLGVTMTDTSTNAPTSWSWTFGDGQTSTLQNPTVVYTLVGAYDVTLVASNATGASAPVTQSVTVTAPETYPVLSSLLAKSGAVGDIVTISGSGFGTVSAGVLFGTVPAVVTSWSDTTIVVTVPAGSRRVPVYVTPSDGPNAGNASNGLMFRYAHVR